MFDPCSMRPQTIAELKATVAIGTERDHFCDFDDLFPHDEVASLDAMIEQESRIAASLKPGTAQHKAVRANIDRLEAARDLALSAPRLCHENDRALKC